MWLLVFVLLAATRSWAQPETPELTRPVNDFADVIDPDSERQLESLIRSLQETTGDVVVVATIDSLEPDERHSRIRRARCSRTAAQGIGQAGKDNGLLVLAAVKDRQVKVEVGYDLEQFITDGFAGETIRQEMAPRFRRGAYGAGLLAGVQRIIGRIARRAQRRDSTACRVRLSGVAHSVAARWKRLHSDDRPLHPHQRASPDGSAADADDAGAAARGAAGAAVSDRLAADSVGAAAGSAVDLADSAAAAADLVDSAAAAAAEAAAGGRGRLGFGGWWVVGGCNA